MVLAALLAVAGHAARADTVGHRLGRARETQQQARARVHTIQARLQTLQARLARRQKALERTTSATLGAQQDFRNTTLRLAVARDRLTMRVRAAYELGPASTIGVLLSAQTPADLASADEFAKSVISADQQAIGAVQQSRAAARERHSILRTRRALLARQTRQVSTLMRRIGRKLALARAAARRAHLRVAGLRRERAALAAAQRRERERRQRLREQRAADSQLVNGNGPGATDPSPPPHPPDPPNFHQAHLLSLLGPTHGRTCGTPARLRDTGQRIAGLATWYGPGFAGNRTASGAIFDPRLFTAAHRTLPFGTFVRVHYQGRCAIVLINDRGPYRYDRVLDLSEAAGHYLGISLNHVTADILVPK
jgi:peptidoglycan hydrolase CwlO-like protein